jgi:folate-binding protein YgfZ
MSSLPNLAAAHPGEYLGSVAVLDFGDPPAEFEALRSGCGLFNLSWRAQIDVTGQDRVRWLHNMVSNNVRDLPLNRGNYNYLLNAQGRILGDMYIYNRGDAFTIETDHAQVESLLSAMKRFIIMDKVEMKVAPRVAMGLCGPKAEELVLALRGMEPLEIRELAANSLTATIVRGPENKPGWFEVWMASQQTGMFGLNADPGARMVGTQALDWWRVAHGIPQYGQDIRDRDLPQETGQMQALNFTKGCYIGQEIVERIRSRGQVHRKFTGFEFDDGLPALGKIESEGRTLAEITSAVSVPVGSGKKNIGLGYVRREVAEAGPRIELGSHKARIVDLPFVI